MSPCLQLPTWQSPGAIAPGDGDGFGTKPAEKRLDAVRGAPNNT